MAKNRTSFLGICCVVIAASVVLAAARGESNRLGAIDRPTLERRLSSLVPSPQDNDTPWAWLHMLLCSGGKGEAPFSSGNGSSWERFLRRLKTDEGWLFRVEGNGLIYVRPSPSGKSFVYEDHYCQTLACLATLGCGPDQVCDARGGKFTLRDLFSQYSESLYCERELSWFLVTWRLLSPSLDESRIVGEDGTLRGISSDELLLRELSKPLYEFACAGTHHLYALAVLRHNPPPGASRRTMRLIEKRLDNHVSMLKKHQMSDGAFPLGFSLPSPFPYTSPLFLLDGQGHHLMWLAVYFTDSDPLAEEWIVKAVECFLRTSEENPICVQRRRPDTFLAAEDTFGGYCHGLQGVVEMLGAKGARDHK